jgi:hypothetical protein
MLRRVGVDPPKVHEVGAALVGARSRFPSHVDVDELARNSRELRKDRELAFYGAEDLIPTEAYGRAEAETALRWAGSPSRPPSKSFTLRPADARRMLARDASAPRCSSRALVALVLASIGSPDLERAYPRMPACTDA